MKIEVPAFSLELLRRILHLPNKMPSKIQIEITNKCNLNCEMCPRKKFNLPNKDIDINLFEQLLTKLENVEVIFPVGWGEAFLHKNFDLIVKTIKSKSLLIKLPTNGTAISCNQTIKTALYIDFLTFSIDEWHNNKHVLDTMKLIIFERNKRNAKRPYITFQLVLNKNNNAIYDIITEAKSIGVDRVNIIRPNFLDKTAIPDWKERKRIYKMADFLGKDLNLRVDMFEFAMFNGVKRWLWKYFKNAFRINSWCPRLSDFLYITIDGQVTPCCYLPRYIVGDLKVQNLYDIWHGEKMSKFRFHHKKICQNCQTLKIK